MKMGPRRNVFDGLGGILNAQYRHAAGGSDPPPPPRPPTRDIPEDAPPPPEDEDQLLWDEIQRWEMKNVPFLDPAVEGSWW